jgi:alkylation response protein AidB-like acyl-CoA dehydrogenase
MTKYQAPLEEIRFALGVSRCMNEQAAASDFEADDVDAILLQCSKLAEKVFSPLNARGDREGCRFENDVVTTPPGFKEAYSTYAKAGWNGVGLPSRLGGQAMPFAVAISVSEMLNSANLSLAMGLMPAPGAIELIDRFGSERQKQIYLPRLISGEWTVTMALTEPQAGSDLGAIATRAYMEDGSLFIKGRKSLITWGEQDLTENIVHLVLARSPNGVPGVKGLSLYLVPKLRLEGGSNDVKCIGIEKKIGLKASPTASLVFGENGAATAELLGRENGGLEQMFILLNQARLRVAAFALGSAERARQGAVGYAGVRVQGRDAQGNPTVIANHPDVRRMLTSMEARTEAIRLLIAYAAFFVDGAHASLAETKVRLEILTPIVKAWCTETGFDVASTGVQIFGGLGYSEECEASQYFREARVHMIYEGTTGVQASDLIFRKVRPDGGRGARKLFSSIEASLTSQSLTDEPGLLFVREQIRASLALLKELTDSILVQNGARLASLRANGAHYLMFSGTVLACWLTWLAALRATASDTSVAGEFSRRKRRNARFLAAQYLAPAAALAESALSSQTFDLCEAGEVE